jgi:hypothetical protein
MIAAGTDPIRQAWSSTIGRGVKENMPQRYARHAIAARHSTFSGSAWNRHSVHVFLAKEREFNMTYVASPSYDRNDTSRAPNLRQCLETARHRLDETSQASETEKIDMLVASAVEAGWEDDEVREA